MKRLLYLFFFILIPATSGGVIIERVAAIVNDEVVTLSELDEAEYLLTNGVMKTEDSGVKGDRKAVKKRILERFIERKL